jgi:hypothetical protein
MHLDLDRELKLLQQMTVPELQARHAEVFGQPTKTHNKLHLIRKIAWRLQSQAEGGLSERALARAAELARDADVRVRPPKDFSLTTDHVTASVSGGHDPRLPGIGGTIVRDYKGEKLRVTVLADGFEYDGRRFRSLSAVAKAISGSHCNGFRFFGLEAAP